VGAQLAATEGDLETAETAFGDAIASAVAEGFTQWAALAAERRGVALGATNPAAARASFGDAAAFYRAWGATSKALELDALAARGVAPL
jgi:hypothetical protein